MNWTAVGTIADIAGAVAVLVSVIYLSIQIRQNTVAVKSASASSYSEASSRPSIVLAENGELNEIFWSLLLGEKEFTVAQTRRVYAVFSLYLHAVEQSYDLYLAGSLAEDKWQGRHRQLRWFANLPGFAPYWEDYGALYPKSFSELLQSVLD